MSDHNNRKPIRRLMKVLAVNEYSQDLKKTLGRWDSIAIIIAVVIGSGIFRVPAVVAQYLSSPNMILLAWLLGGIISLLGALCYAELSTSFPKTGGTYIYLRESYGLWCGFLFGWTELLVIRAGSIAATAFICAEYLQSFLSIHESLVKPIAVFIVVVVSSVNMIGLRYGKKVLDALTITKLLALAAVIVLGFMSKKGTLSHFSSAPVTFDGGIFSLLGLALIPILWTYGGWHENTFVAGETKNAAKALPFALIVGISVVTALYLTMNFLYLYLFPVEKIVDSNLIASDMLQVLWGNNGKKILEALIIISSLGGLNAMIITGSRITYALGKDNAIFRWMGKVDAKQSTPIRAIVINGALAIILVLLGTFNKLLFFTGVSVWLFFALATSGLFILRYKFPNIERPYKVWGYPAIPAVFILVCTALFINTIICSPFESIVGLCLTMTGIPIFIISQRKKASTRE